MGEGDPVTAGSGAGQDSACDWSRPPYFAAIGERFQELRQPVLLIWGRQDPTIPFEIGDRMAALLPCRQFVPLLALHRPHHTVPDTVASSMDAFLRRPGCPGDSTQSRVPSARR